MVIAAICSRVTSAPILWPGIASPVLASERINVLAE
jgi:hypothetical protein